VSRNAPEHRSVALFGFLVFAWGLNYLVVRDLTRFGGPLWLATGRAGIGGVVALALLAFPGERGHLSGIDKRDAFLLGLLNTGGMYGLWFLAASQVPPGETSVLVYTLPLQVALLAVPVLGHRARAMQGIALGVGLFGVVLMTEPWSTARLEVLAIAALLLSSFSWALGTVLYQRRFRGAQLREGNSYQLLGGAALLLLLSIAIEPAGVPTPSPTFWVEILYLGVLGTALAYGAWFTLLAKYPAETLSSYTILVPVVALAASVLVDGERLDLVQLCGVGLVLVSLYAIGLGRGNVESPPRAPADARPDPGPLDPAIP
jgi:probable blue pigment (indigoidine) exporter